MIDTKKTERIPPEIWLNSVLSLARYYGAAVINGTVYTLDVTTNELTRDDIYKADKKTWALAEKTKWEAIREQQGGLF